MVKKLEGSFKGLKFIGSLRETLRGGKRKASWSDTDTSELIRFSKVGTRYQQIFNAAPQCNYDFCYKYLQNILM